MAIFLLSPFLKTHLNSCKIRHRGVCNGPLGGRKLWASEKIKPKVITIKTSGPNRKPSPPPNPMLRERERQTQESATWQGNWMLWPPTSADRISGNIVEFLLKCCKKKKEIKYKVKCSRKFPVESGSLCVMVPCDCTRQSSKNTNQHPSKNQGGWK